MSTQTCRVRKAATALRFRGGRFLVAFDAPGGTYPECGSATGVSIVLNIGRLAPGAAEYYIGEVATSAEDYYTGQGESEGRWVGSLAAHFGLHGPVAPDDFRAVLEGRNPQTGEHLVRRAGRRQHRPPAAGQPTLFDGDHLDVPQLAARLRLSTRQVRRLLATTEEAARTRRSLNPSTVLLARRAPAPPRVEGARCLGRVPR